MKMTVEEINDEIDKLEKKIENLKQLKRKIQGTDIFQEEKEKWIGDARLAIDIFRAFRSHEAFSKVVEELPRYEMRSFIYGGDRAYINGVGNKELEHGFRIMLGPIIKSVTHGRCSGLINKETREYQLTDEEVNQVRIRLNKRIDDWCNKWHDEMRK